MKKLLMMAASYAFYRYMNKSARKRYSPRGSRGLGWTILRGLLNRR